MWLERVEAKSQSMVSGSLKNLVKEGWIRYDLDACLFKKWDVLLVSLNFIIQEMGRGPRRQ